MTDASTVAERVSDLLGVPCGGVRRVSGGDISEAWLVETDQGQVFAKTMPGTPTGSFTIEAAGLDWLREPGAVAVPKVLGVDEAILILDHVPEGRPSRATAEQLGVGLAALHTAGADGFGSVPPGGGTAGFIARLGVTDMACATWPEFFVTHRLEPLSLEAERRGMLPDGARRRIDRICGRLEDPGDDLAGPPEPPARLHGDLWGGNVLWGADGRAWLIDPAAYGGHRETDLAMMHLFGGFPEATFAAYDEVAPPAEGRDERIRLHQLLPLLVHACLFGGSYGAQADQVARAYS